MMDYGTQAYLSQEVDSADPAQLVELLYQRALRDLSGARDQWDDAANPAAAVHLAIHAQTIIQELHKSLNYQDGGDLSVNLSRLYEYMQFTLVEALTSRQPRDVAKIAEVLELLEPLADAWSTIARDNYAARSENVFSNGGNLVA